MAGVFVKQLVSRRRIPVPSALDTMWGRNRVLSFSSYSAVSSATNSQIGKNTKKEYARVDSIFNAKAEAKTSQTLQRNTTGTTGVQQWGGVEPEDSDWKETVSDAELLGRALSHLKTLSLEESVELFRRIAAHQTALEDTSRVHLDPSSEGTYGMQPQCSLQLRYDAFWQEAVFELQQVHFSQHASASGGSLPTTERGTQSNQELCLELLNVLSAVHFPFTPTHRPILAAFGDALEPLAKFPEKLVVGSKSRSPVHTIKAVLGQCVALATGIVQLAQIHHVELCLPTLKTIRSALLEDTRILGSFLAYHKDTDSSLQPLCTSNDLALVMNAMATLSIFSPEFLTAALLWQRRAPHQMLPHGYICLLQAAGSFLMRESLTLRGVFEGVWLMQRTLYHARLSEAQEMRRLLALAETETNTSTPILSDGRDSTMGDVVDLKATAVSGKSGLNRPPSRGGWYDQSFFDAFEKMTGGVQHQTAENTVMEDASTSRTTANPVLSLTHAGACVGGAPVDKAPMVSSTPHIDNGEDLFCDKAFEDVTDSWVADSLFDVPRRLAKAEVTYLVKHVTTKLVDEAGDFHYKDGLAVLEVLSTIAYAPGALIDAIVQRCLQSQVYQIRPKDVVRCFQCLVQLDVRCTNFLQHLCEHVVNTSSEYSCKELVECVKALLTLRCSHSDLFYKLLDRKDEFLGRSATLEDLHKIQAAFRSLDIRCPDLDKALLNEP